MTRAAAWVGAVVLMLAVGAAAFLLARGTADHTDPDAALPPPAGDARGTFAVDGRSYPCLSSGTVRLTAEVDGASSATFVADGMEVASEPSVDTVFALLPVPLTTIRCDDGRTHRIEVVTDHADGCRLAAVPNATFAEARGHATESTTAALPLGVCTLTIHD